MKIDWLSLTIPYTGDDGLENYPEHGWLSRKNTAAPMHGYSQAWELENGGYLMVPNSQNKRMRVLLMFGGTSLTEWRGTGSTDDSIIRYFFGQTYRPQFTRIDFAFDTDNPLAAPAQIAEAWREKRIKTHIRTIRTHTTEKRGKDPAGTVYLGSVSSGRQVVIYDKAKQLKLLDEAWTRVELRCRKSFAQSAASDSLKHGSDAVARATIRELLTTDIGWFNDMIAGGDVDLTELGRKKTGGTLEWLHKQVQPAIENLIDDGDIDDIAKLAFWLETMKAKAHDALAAIADSQVEMMRVENDLSNY